MTATAKLKIITTALCAMMVSAWGGVVSAADLSIGKIDLQELYRKSRRMQVAQLSVREIQIESNVKLGKLSQEAKDIENKLKAGQETLKPDQRSELLNHLKAKRDEIKAEREAAQVKIDFKRRSIESSLGPEVKKAIAKVAKEAGLKAVLPTRLFAYDAGIVDITEKVAIAFDSAEAEQKPTAPSSPAPEGKK